MEPKEGTDSDFDDWYRKQHLDCLSMFDPYRCASRYQLRESENPNTPKYLCLHEYESIELPEERARASETEWSKKILNEAKSFQRLRWSFVKAYGKRSTNFSEPKI